jgi:hypothetical protein
VHALIKTLCTYEKVVLGGNWPLILDMSEDVQLFYTQTYLRLQSGKQILWRCSSTYLRNVGKHLSRIHGVTSQTTAIFTGINRAYPCESNRQQSLHSKLFTIGVTSTSVCVSTGKGRKQLNNCFKSIISTINPPPNVDADVLPLFPRIRQPHK